MKIKDVNVYALEESIVASRFPMDTGKVVDNFEEEVSRIKILTVDEVKKLTATKLAKAELGSGHDCYLKGIIVQANIRYKQYWSMQVQRYNWFNIVSSNSKMHRITELVEKDYKHKENKTAMEVELCNIVEQYKNKEVSIDDVMDYVPMSFELWERATMNYLQLKAVYQQRRNHKSREWQDFCDWIETLPLSFLITESYNEKVELKKLVKELQGQVVDLSEENRHLNLELEQILNEKGRLEGA